MHEDVVQTISTTMVLEIKKMFADCYERTTGILFEPLFFNLPILYPPVGHLTYSNHVAAGGVASTFLLRKVRTAHMPDAKAKIVYTSFRERCIIDWAICFSPGSHGITLNVMR